MTANSSAAATLAAPLTAFSLFSQQKEIEGRKLKLSRMSFVKDGLRISGSVLPRIAPSVIAITIYATVIAVANFFFGRHWQASNSVIGPLSVVVGLLLVFRNGTSYDRWYEGRKIWQDSNSTVLSLAQAIWFNVDVHAGQPLPNTVADGKPVPTSHWRLHRKRRALRLLVAYMYACKHHLRGEHGRDWPDYHGILPHDWVSNPSQPFRSKVRDPSPPAPEDRNDSSSASNGRRSSIDDLEASAAEARPLLSSSSKAADLDAARSELDLPTMILSELMAYLVAVRRAKLLEEAGPPCFSMMAGMLNTLSSQLATMERISSTTIPVMYGIHLKQCCLLYLLTLPLTLVVELGWRMVPVVTLVSITLIGLEGISSEIEDPFGDDPSDHPLDLFCSSLRYDVEQLIAQVDPEIRQE